MCKNKGHKKLDCPKLQTWLDNKKKSRGNNFSFVCFESYLVDVPINSQYHDSGLITHIDVYVHRFRNMMYPNLKERNMRVGNDLVVVVVSMRDVNIYLDYSFKLVLKKYLYVLSFTRNFISISLLDELGFSFPLCSRKISMEFNF